MAALWHWLWGRGLRGNNATCSTLSLLSVTYSTTHKQIGSFSCWFPGGWFVYILGPSSLFNELPSEARSFSCHLNPHRFFQSEVLRLYFPTWEPWVVCSVLLLSCSSWFIHTQMWDCFVHQLLPFCEFSPPWLCITAPLSSLDECFLFNSLVVGLPYSSIFWQFWLFFACKVVVVFLLFVQGSKVYLPMPPSWLEVKIFIVLYILHIS